MKEYTKGQILKIANYQIKIIFFMIYCILLNLGSLRFPLISLLLAGGMAYFMYKLATSLAMKFSVLYAILAFIPIVSLITLIILNQKATRVLFHAGLRVGLFGGDKAELERFKNSKVWGSAK